MYNVDSDYLNQIFSVGIKYRRIFGKIDGIAFTSDDVIAESLSMSRQLTSNSEVRLGGVYISQLGLTFTRQFAQLVERGTWRGREVEVFIGLLVTNRWVDVPLGIFYIDEANHTAAGVQVKAYDAMTKFDKKMTLTSTGGHIYNLLSMACSRCGVEMAQTQEEIEDLPNGLETFSMYPDNDIETWRDFISHVSVLIGGYCTINREGKLEVRNWKSEPDLTLGVNDRFSGGSYSDFITYYTGVYLTDIASKTVKYYQDSFYTGGLTMNIGANPFLQYGLQPYIQQLCRNILHGMEGFRYVPFKVSSHIDPILDLGDVIKFTDGLAGMESIGCVMKVDYSFRKGVTIEGFGKNPALAGAQSKTDKNIAGLMSSSFENEMVYVKYANAEEIDMACDSSGVHHPIVNIQPLGNLYLTAVKDTNIEIHTRVTFEEHTLDYLQNGSDHPNYYRFALIYRLDGELVARIPFSEDEIYTSRSINARPQTIEDFHSYIGLESGNQRTLSVYLELTQAETQAVDEWCPAIRIGQEGIQITVIGQGLSKEEEWDGVIRLTDALRGFRIKELGYFTLTEAEASASLVGVEKNSPSDVVTLHSVNDLGVAEMQEALNVFLRYEQVYLLTSDGDNLVTSDGDKLLL